jgi:hypothetical protein
VANKLQIESNKIKLLMEYKNIIQKVLFDIAVLSALMCGRKYVIPQNDDCSSEARCVLWFFETESVIKTQRRYITQYGRDLPSDNAIRLRLKQFQETCRVVVAIETVTLQMLEDTWREIVSYV